jgi:hypothetical protein
MIDEKFDRLIELAVHETERPTRAVAAVRQAEEKNQEPGKAHA